LDNSVRPVCDASIVSFHPARIVWHRRVSKKAAGPLRME
jgi:hypothetical protein